MARMNLKTSGKGEREIMPLEHVNRRGDRYFVLQGKTKTGKPKYYASKKNSGTPVEELPPGLEIFEHAESALVSIRKRKPSRILPQQRELICHRIRDLTDLQFFRVDIDGDDLIVYIPDRDPNLVTAAFARIFGESESSLSHIRDWTSGNVRYVAELKFTLTDPTRELFTAS